MNDFFTDNQSEVFNHNCKNGVLLCSIRARCGIEPDGMYENEVLLCISM